MLKTWNNIILLACMCGLALLTFSPVILSPIKTRRRLPQPVFQKVATGQTTVPPGEYRYISFRVDPQKMHGAHLMGTFHALGTSSDVQALVVEQGEFQKWKSARKDYQLLYSAEQVLDGRFNVPITTAGFYDLVFSNTSGPLEAKRISTEVELRYVSPR